MELFKGLLEGLEFELFTIALLVGRELALIDRGLDTQALVKDVDNEGHGNDDKDEGDRSHSQMLGKVEYGLPAKI